MLKKVFLVGLTASLLLSMQLNILSTASAEEFNKNVQDETALLRQYMSDYPTGDGMSTSEMRKAREQWKLKMFQENLPRALAFIKELDSEFYDLVTKDDKLMDEYKQDFMKHIELWLKFQQTASPRAELELKQLVFSGHLELLERQYHADENKEKRKQIRDGMKSLLTRFFDVKIKIREFEIQELQAELNKLKEQVQHARNNKAEQIDIFLMKMTASETKTIFDN
jgi:hypothetical protein